jgi:predicted RNase H-like HicB family nuclease
MEYIVVIERAEDGSYSAYVPDLPGCVACGDTSAEAEALIVEALHLHLEALRRRGDTIPQPTARSFLVPAAAV